MIAVAVARHLAATVDGLTMDETLGTGNVFIDWMPSTPDVAAAVMSQPGEPQLTNDPSDVAGVQVLIRAARGDVRPGHAMARTVYSELTCLDLVTLDDGGPDEVFVVGCTALQSDPAPIGQDENQRPEWSLNFRLHTHAPTAHRT